MKKCIKCGEVKSIEHYYAHAKMADLHLNKCKNCCKSDIRENIKKRKLDPIWVEKERERGREKYHRLSYKNNPIDKDSRKRAISNYIKKYPEKSISRNRTKIKAPKGFNVHHWSYNIDHCNSVFILSISDHSKIHRFLKYDSQTFYYRSISGLLLDTFEKHKNYISQLIESNFLCIP